jgi:3',5'-cyclic AMP phosphodiesterase CpdA
MFTRRQFLLGAAAVVAAATGGAKSAPLAAKRAVIPQLVGPQPIRIAMLSDCHTQAATEAAAGAINGKLAKAVADLQQLQPAIWLCNGDVSDHGLALEFAAYKQILLGVAKPQQLVVTTGNHELFDHDATDPVALARFQAAFGLPQAYSSRVVGQIHLVMLADEQHKSAPKNRDWAWLSPEQLRWFEKVLAEHKDQFTVVCLHQPLQDTVLWSEEGNNFGGCGQSADIQAILQRNPQVKLWFSGHTHQRAEAKGQMVTKGGVTYVGLGSTFYLFNPGTYQKDLGASQSRMLELWPDYVLLRTRDHTTQAWLEPLELRMALK